MNKRKPLNRDTKFILMISLSVFAIIFMIFFVIQRNKNDNYNNIKEDKSNYIVYTKYQKKGKIYFVYVPYVNIDSQIAKSINEDIDSFVSEFINSKKTMISYDYNINGIILSLVVKVVDYDTKYAPEPYFRTYNINLNTLELLSDDALLNYYGVNEENVEMAIENQFHQYYDKIVEKKFYNEKECDYKCFLKYRDVENYLDGVVYYIDKGNLIAYKPFIFYSIYGEEDYFKEKHFKFLIVKKES